MLSDQDLLHAARLLWPQQRPMQARWLRAIRLLRRRTTHGWLLERPTTRTGSAS